ncbi:hypothetical protein ACFE04_014343 [Oxalis oulophora]
MASSACKLGAANVRLAELGFDRARFSSLQHRNTVRMWIGQKPLHYAGLVISHQPEKAFNLCCRSSITNISSVSKENESSALETQLFAKPSEVESLVTDVCNSTSIAEFDLKLGGFRLHLKRDTSPKTSQLPPSTPPPLPPSPAPVTASTTKVDLTGTNGSVFSPSLAITKPSYSTGGVESFLERAKDEGLIILTAPLVGFFRRSRTIKGKRAPPSCKENQVVKEGQVVCWVEQLGGEIPVESDVAGEVVRILREDGEPIGYGDALLAVLPSFPGIKKL